MSPNPNRYVEYLHLRPPVDSLSNRLRLTTHPKKGTKEITKGTPNTSPRDLLSITTHLAAQLTASNAIFADCSNLRTGIHTIIIETLGSVCVLGVEGLSVNVDGSVGVQCLLCCVDRLAGEFEIGDQRIQGHVFSWCSEGFEHALGPTGILSTIGGVAAIGLGGMLFFQQLFNMLVQPQSLKLSCAEVLGTRDIATAGSSVADTSESLCHIPFCAGVEEGEFVSWLEAARSGVDCAAGHVEDLLIPKSTTVLSNFENQ